MKTSRFFRSTSLLLVWCFLFAAWLCPASAQFTVAPGGTTYIQNLSGTPWYFFAGPSPATAQMARVSQNLGTVALWGSANFHSDNTGVVNRVQPLDFLRITAGSTAVGTAVTLTYYTDSSFDSSSSMNVTVQTGNAQVVSMTRLDARYTFASSVRWEIFFDKAVAGVRAQNLSLTTTGSLAPVPAITSVVPSAGSSDYRHWTVTANVAGTGTGQVTLNWIGASIESPAVPGALTGHTYDIRTSGFTCAPGGTFFIQNQTNEAWHFGSGPLPATTRMSRWKDVSWYPRSTNLGDWGTPEFYADPLAVKNAINPGEYLAITTTSVSIGGLVSVAYFTESVGQQTLQFGVQSEQAQITAIERMDATPRSAPTSSWRIVFNRPVAGMRNPNVFVKNWAGMNTSLVSLVPESGDYSHWIATLTTNAHGSGLMGLNCQQAYTYDDNRIFNQPPIAATFSGESYYLNPIVLSMAPGSTLDLENVDGGDWLYHVAPTPSTATMSRVGPSTVGVLPWGTAGFLETGTNSSNKIHPREFLRVEAGSTETGPIVIRQYNTLLAADPGYTVTINLEVPAAQVVSLNIIDPNPTVQNSVRWELVFSAPVSGVTAANFRFINASQIQPTPAITSIVPVGNTGTTYRITANTEGTGIGLVGLRYIGHASESPAVYNSFTGQLYDFSSYPLITQEPVPASTVVVTGGTAPTFTVTATVRTAATLNYQWKRGSSQFPLDAVDVPGATSASFTPPTATAGDYSYFCHVFTTPGYDRDSLTVVLRVLNPPIIHEVLPDKTLAPGGTMIFSVVALGTALQYQWFEGESGDRSHQVSGATAYSYTTPALFANKRCWVLVSNALGVAYEKTSASMLARVITQVQQGQSTFSPVILSTLNNITARALDSDGNPTPGATITFELLTLGYIGDAAPGGNFGGALYAGGTALVTAVTNAQGWATAPALWTNTAAGSYLLSARCQGPTSSVGGFITIDNQPLPVSGFVFITSPPTTLTAGQLFSVELKPRDAWGNLIATPLTVTVRRDHGTGALQGVTSATTIGGTATFTDLSYLVAEKIDFRFECGAAVYGTPDTTVLPGPASLVATFSGHGQTAFPGAAFAQSLKVKVTDFYGNAVANSSVTFSAPAPGATATFSTAATIMTNGTGFAQVSVIAGSVSGTYTVSAHLSSGLGLSPAFFTLANYSRLEAWRAANFAGEFRNTGNAADGAMPFKDGVPNLLKYALNLNATTADSTPMTSTGSKGVPLIAQDGAGRLTVTFVRRKSTFTPGITYTVQFSNSATGTTFAVNPAAITNNLVSLDATWERVTVTDSVIPNAAQPMRFARLVVSNP